MKINFVGSNKDVSGEDNRVPNNVEFEQSDAFKQKTFEIVKRSCVSKRRKGVVNKIEKCGLEDLVFDLFYREGMTISDITKCCNSRLEEEGRSNIKISEHNVGHWLRKLKSYVEAECGYKEVEKAKQAYEVLDEMNRVGKRMSVVLNDCLDDADFENPFVVENTKNIYAMWSDSTKMISNFVDKKLPSPPITEETLSEYVRFIMRSILSFERIDYDTRTALVGYLRNKLLKKSLEDGDKKK